MKSCNLVYWEDTCKHNIHTMQWLHIHACTLLLWTRNTTSNHRQVQNYLLGTMIVFNESQLFITILLDQILLYPLDIWMLCYGISILYFPNLYIQMNDLALPSFLYTNMFDKLQICITNKTKSKAQLKQLCTSYHINIQICVCGKNSDIVRAREIRFQN
jgi:hypothetical protein